MDKIIIALLGGLLGGGSLMVAILNFIQFLIQRKDKITKENDTINKTQNSKLDDIESRISYLEKGSLRTQLLQLISSFPDRSEEIIKVARAYFVKCDGNWYVTSIFNDYLNSKGLLHPKWFDFEYHKNKNDEKEV